MVDYQMLIENFENNPRNVRTIPTDGRAPRWFWVSAERGTLYVSSGTTPGLNSSIRGRRSLDASELQPILDLYQRRKRGEPVSVEASRITQNQVYWYGIFADLGL